MLFFSHVLHLYMGAGDTVQVSMHVWHFQERAEVSPSGVSG